MRGKPCIFTGLDGEEAAPAVTGRIEILQWREHGDDEDCLTVTAMAAADTADAYDIAAQIEADEAGKTLSFSDDDAEHPCFSTNHVVMADGHVITGHDGRKWRVSIREVAE